MRTYGLSFIHIMQSNPYSHIGCCRYKVNFFYSLFNGKANKFLIVTEVVPHLG